VDVLLIVLMLCFDAFDYTRRNFISFAKILLGPLLEHRTKPEVIPHSV